MATIRYYVEQIENWLVENYFDTYFAIAVLLFIPFIILMSIVIAIFGRII